MISNDFDFIVIQPGTVCNLDCSYCYLPTRHLNLKMGPWVAKNIVQSIADQNSENLVTVIWHGGEPMATGVNHLRKLVEPFENLRKKKKIVHSIQTNATLINPRWCDFFQEFEFQVGVSIDGPEWANLKRVDLRGKNTFPQSMRGIQHLKNREIPFSVISVVHEANIERVEEFYEFFCQLGCYSLAINIEEAEGVNIDTGQIIDDNRISAFWRRLYVTWRTNPVIRIREFNRTLSYIEAILDNREPSTWTQQAPFPTIGWNGQVFMLSPEFAGIKSKRYNDFIVGNLLYDTLADIIRLSRKTPYVTDFETGVKACRKECAFFKFCGGGYASNKFFQHGTTRATETVDCRNSRKRLLEAILESV